MPKGDGIPCLHLAHLACAIVSACACLQAQLTIAGRVVDEIGAGIEGARLEFRPADGGGMAPAFSDPVAISA